MGRGQRGGVVPQARFLGRRDVVHDDVGRGQQPRQQGAALGRREVGGRAALVGVEVGEETAALGVGTVVAERPALATRSEEYTSELQSRQYLVCRLLLEKKKKKNT